MFTNGECGQAIYTLSITTHKKHGYKVKVQI